MALTLTEAAKLSNDTLYRGVVDVFAQNAPVIDMLPFMEVEGNAYKYNRVNALPGAEFRAVNAAYTESTPTFTQASSSLVILGGDADVDRYLVQTRGNINDLRAEVLATKVKSLSYKFQDGFINGDVAVDANSFDGLKKMLAGAQVISAGTNGLAVLGASDADRQTFLDQLDALIAAVPGGPDALFMNASILAKLRSAMRRLTINSQTVDDFGRTVDIYNGVRMYDIGNKADGTPIIPQTETQGTATNASSIYAVKFGNGPQDLGVTGLQNGDMAVIDKGLLETKNVYRHTVEWYVGLAMFGTSGAARLAGVLNA